MQEFNSLSIFDREKYERLKELTYEITYVGDVTLSNVEKSILRMPPQFSIIETLQEGTIEFEQELSYGKLRIQLNKELKIEECEEEEKASVILLH